MTPNFDHVLYLKSQMNATGANLHRIRNLAHGYMAFWELGNRHGWPQDEIERFTKQEQEMRSALNKGQICKLGK